MSVETKKIGEYAETKKAIETLFEKWEREAREKKALGIQPVYVDRRRAPIKHKPCTWYVLERKNMRQRAGKMAVPKANTVASCNSVEEARAWISNNYKGDNVYEIVKKGDKMTSFSKVVCGRVVSYRAKNDPIRSHSIV